MESHCLTLILCVCTDRLASRTDRFLMRLPDFEASNSTSIPSGSSWRIWCARPAVAAPTMRRQKLGGVRWKTALWSWGTQPTNGFYCLSIFHYSSQDSLRPFPGVWLRPLRLRHTHLNTKTIRIVGGGDMLFLCCCSLSNLVARSLSPGMIWLRTWSTSDVA